MRRTKVPNKSGLAWFILLVILAVLLGKNDKTEKDASEEEQPIVQHMVDAGLEEETEEEPSVRYFYGTKVPVDVVNRTVINYNEIAEYPVPDDILQDVKSIYADESDVIGFSMYHYHDKENNIYVEFSTQADSKRLWISITDLSEDGSKLFPVTRDYFAALRYSVTDEEILTMLEEAAEDTYTYERYDFKGTPVRASHTGITIWGDVSGLLE